MPGPETEPGDETLTVLRFQRLPIGVLNADPMDLRCFMLVGNSSKSAATPWRMIPSKDMSESNSQLKSLILAQNERWRQA